MMCGCCTGISGDSLERVEIQITLTISVNPFSGEGGNIHLDHTPRTGLSVCAYTFRNFLGFRQNGSSTSRHDMIN